MDIAAWLHGLGLQQYEQAFCDNAIDAGGGVDRGPTSSGSTRFAIDSPPEGRRFELSVPPEKDWRYETIVIDLRTLLVRERK